MKGKHLIAISDFSRQELDLILERTSQLKSALKSGRQAPSLAGKSVAMIFEKQSTRTRVSYQVGIAQLGGHPVFLPGHELQLTRGEPIKDTARVLSRYVDAVVIRANRHEDVVEFARWSQVPVINALTDLLHPCQILADLFTMQECGLDLDSATVCWIGDGNNVANSWINAAAAYRFRLVLACPEGYDPDPAVLDRARQTGARAEIVRDPREAVRGAHVLYSDVWVSMGQEQEKEERRRVFKPYCISEQLVKLADPAVKIMHCLPAHRGEEITDEAIESQNSIVFDQAENRLHAQKAILELVVGT